MNKSGEVLLALRKIVRALDLHSKVLSCRFGITYPQLVVLDALYRLGQVPVGQLATRINLSHATVTGIVARLEQKGLISRQRGEDDRRVVLVQLEGPARGVLEQAPPLVQETFSSAFGHLKSWEQNNILYSLERVADMMAAHVPEDEKTLLAQEDTSEGTFTVGPLLQIEPDQNAS